MRKLRVIDLFSGIGGFSKGLEDTGAFETARFCEMKPHARAVLEKNFGPVPCDEDVTTMQFKEGEADVITAGFPCQDISFAGDGAGLAGARSGLYREVIRAIRLVRPRWAVLENVAALLSRGLGTVLGDMAKIGYDAEWHCIPASAVGAPHRRDRIWIVANPGGEQHEGCRAPLSGSLAAQLFGANNVADAESQRGDESGFGAESSGWSKSANGREEMADSECIGQSGPWKPIVSSYSETIGEGEAGNAFHGGIGNQWAVEPDVGRVAHGFSQKLDGALNAEELNSEVGAAFKPSHDLLSGLRGDPRPTKASSRLFKAGAGGDPMQAMPFTGGSAGRSSESEAGEALQGLREDVSTQSQQEAQHMQPTVSFDAWPYECDEAVGAWAWEPNVPRVASGVKQRVDRLAELGNAVVPQIPQMIGYAILEAEGMAA
jgi:DNA (cytosine-5)-methyltransferase 1